MTRAVKPLTALAETGSRTSIAASLSLLATAIAVTAISMALFDRTRRRFDRRQQNSTPAAAKASGHVGRHGTSLQCFLFFVESS